MQFLTTYPVSLVRSIPQKAIIKAIYATVRAPFGSSDQVRVRVVWAGSVGTPPRQVAEVQIRPGGETWRVFPDQLKNLSFFTASEVS